MQNYAYNSPKVLNHLAPPASTVVLNTQMNAQQLELHLELQNQLNKTKKLSEDDYEYYDEEEEYDENELGNDDDDDDDQHNQSLLSKSHNMIKRPKGELACVVCGASANGYNFDAITCESCKAFFRRNAFRPLNLFRCSNNNQCEINVQTRKKCKKCRIVKCFNLGMRRDWIMTEMEREEKKRKIVENRKKKTNEVGCSSQDSIQNTESTMQASIVKPIRRRRRRRRHSLLADSKQCESTNQDLIINNNNNNNNNKKQATNMNNNNNRLMHKQIQSPYSNTMYYQQERENSSQLVYATSYACTSSSHHAQIYYDNGNMLKRNENNKNVKASVSNYSTLSPQSINSQVSQPPSNSSSPSLPSTSCEQAKHSKESTTIDAIRAAYKQAIQLVKAHGQPKDSDNINDTVNLTELGVRRIIFYFKLISDFRNLNHELMIKLLKQNMMNIIQIHGINSYNKQDNTFKEPGTDDIPFSAESLQTVYGQEIYNKILNITINLFDLCHGDTVYIKLLMLIILFDPNNENLTSDEKVFIKGLQDKYMNLTYASLCDQLGCSTKANLVFKGMIFEMNKISDLGRWFEKTVVEKSDSEFVRPLMKEVFSFPSDHTPPSSIASSSTTTSSNNSIQSIGSVQIPSVVQYQSSPLGKIDIKQEAS